MSLSAGEEEEEPSTQATDERSAAQGRWELLQWELRARGSWWERTLLAAEPDRTAPHWGPEGPGFAPDDAGLQDAEVLQSGGNATASGRPEEEAVAERAHRAVACCFILGPWHANVAAVLCELRTALQTLQRHGAGGTRDGGSGDEDQDMGSEGERVEGRVWGSQAKEQLQEALALLQHAVGLAEWMWGQRCVDAAAREADRRAARTEEQLTLAFSKRRRVGMEQ